MDHSDLDPAAGIKGFFWGVGFMLLMIWFQPPEEVTKFILERYHKVENVRCMIVRK